MGPFQEYEEKKSEKGSSPRSRIPRLVLHPFRPKEKGTGSPLSDSPFSEEEGKDCDMRTVSTHSFCSDDTGCPATSQSVSPSSSSDTAAGSDNSPHDSPSPPERKTSKVKRVRLMAEWSAERITAPRKKREQRTSTAKPRGSEADFSSSSSTGSLRNKETLVFSSTGKKTSSRSRGSRIRPHPVFKPAGSPTANHDAELYAPYRTPPRAPSSTNDSSASSPTSRRVSLACYHSCGENHGIKPPNPEQYLTPLQQKEVSIRHLKTKLRESVNTVRDREAEIEELKCQLGRMREDWIEEECHRVEAQLSLKEARKEIKQLRQVVETMKSSLMEKDKGIQKYFVDINIQNRKLESLLHSMELAQSGSALHDDEPASLDDGSGREERKMEEEEEEEGGMGMGMELGDQAAEEMADSGLLVNDEMANREDILEQVLMSTAMDSSQDLLRAGPGCPGVSTLLADGDEEFEKTTSAAPPPPPTQTPPPPPPPPSTMYTTFTTCSRASCPSQHVVSEDRGVQTDAASSVPPADLHALLLQLLKLHGGGDALPSPSSASSVPEPSAPPTPDPVPSRTAATPAELTDSTAAPPKPCSSPDTTSDSGLCCPEPSSSESQRFMEELDFTVGEADDSSSSSSSSSSCVAPVVGGKRYWSDSFLVDLVAVAAPVLPTVAWLYSRHGVDGGAPVYNIAALVRGCCVVGLRTLRHVAHGSEV